MFTGLGRRRRREHNRSSEESYISPQLSKVLDFKVKACLEIAVEKPTSSTNKRVRREQGSSEEEEAASAFPNVISEDLRVGGPYLCRLPFEYLIVPRNEALDYWRARSDKMRQEVTEILRGYGISPTIINVERIRSKHHFDPRSITVLMIEAERKNLDNSWARAVEKLLAYCRDNGMKDLHVEIHNPLGHAKAFLYPIQTSEAVFGKWTVLRDRILDILKFDEWVSLECFRRGTTPDPELCNPTVVISVEPHSSRDWNEVSEKVLEILSNENLPEVGIVVEASSIIPLTSIHKPNIDMSGRFEGLSSGLIDYDSLYSVEAKPGMSLGPHNSNISASTFGGYFEVKFENSSWKRFGVTCFHCVDIPDKDLPEAQRPSFHRWRENGVSTHDAGARTLLRMDMPALHDHEKFVSMKKEAIEQLKKHMAPVQAQIDKDEFVLPYEMRNHNRDRDSLQQDESEKAKAEAFSAEVGFVAAASGYQTVKVNNRECQMDWALINVKDERMASEDGMVGPRHILAASSDLEGMSFWSFGRASGNSSGRYSMIMSAQLHQGDKGPFITHEHVFIGQFFAQPDDSGAFVLGPNKRSFFGVLFASEVITNRGYVMHANDLFADIKLRTGAVDIRLPG